MTLFENRKRRNMPILAQIQEDLDIYERALCENNVSLCLLIEKRYSLDGYPPNIVMSALQAGAKGENMGQIIDDLLG